MRYAIGPMTKTAARAIAAWRYPGPYATYDLGGPAGITELLDPAAGYVAVFEADAGRSEPVGFFAFGPSARVPGGHRAGVYGAEALDIGFGLRPDLTGRGLGTGFVRAGLAYAAEQFRPPAFRLSVAAWNRRAIRAYEVAGFVPGPTFVSSVRGTEVPFLLMTRIADPPDSDRPENVALGQDRDAPGQPPGHTHEDDTPR